MSDAPEREQWIELPLLPNDDAEITCLYRRAPRPCELALRVLRPGERAVVGVHAACLEPLRKRNVRGAEPGVAQKVRRRSGESTPDTLPAAVLAAGEQRSSKPQVPGSSPGPGLRPASEFPELVRARAFASACADVGCGISPELEAALARQFKALQDRIDELEAPVLEGIRKREEADARYEAAMAKGRARQKVSVAPRGGCACVDAHEPGCRRSAP